jgi:hypothetical protein
LEIAMGAAKHEMMRQEDLQSIGGVVAVRARALKHCLFHEDILLNQGDSEADRKAYAIGTNMLKAGEVDAGREEFMDAIKAAIDDSYEECPYCARLRDD